MVIVCLGEALIDLVPPAGRAPGNAAQLAVHPGGAPLNISVGLSRLNKPAHFLGCISTDSFGDKLIEVLEADGIPRSPAERVGEPTRLAVIDHTNPTAPFRFYGDSPADSALSTEHVEEVFRRTGVAGLYVGSLMMTSRQGNLIQRHAIDRALERGIPVYADPNPRPSAWPDHRQMVEATGYLLSVSRLAKLSLDDASSLGWPATPVELIEYCEDRFSATIFVTGGAAGSWARVGGNDVHTEATRIDPVDPTGAGDASFAALLSKFHDTGELNVPALRFAAAAGAITALSRGAISTFPTSDEIEAWTARQPYSSST